MPGTVIERQGAPKPLKLQYLMRQTTFVSVHPTDVLKW